MTQQPAGPVKAQTFKAPAWRERRAHCRCKSSRAAVNRLHLLGRSLSDGDQAAKVDGDGKLAQ